MLQWCFFLFKKAGEFIETQLSNPRSKEALEVGKCVDTFSCRHNFMLPVDLHDCITQPEPITLQCNLLPQVDIHFVRG